MNAPISRVLPTPVASAKQIEGKSALELLETGIGHRPVDPADGIARGLDIGVLRRGDQVDDVVEPPEGFGLRLAQR